MTERRKPPRWQDMELGCIIPEPGTGRLYRTGDWRTAIPETDEKLCVNCGVCWVFCPDMCRKSVAAGEAKADGSLAKKGIYDVDEYYCKGCAICATECPTRAITMKGD